MNFPVWLLLLSLDVWAVPSGLRDVATSGIPDFLADARPPISEADRKAIHLGDGVPCFFLEEPDVPAFLKDPNSVRKGDHWIVEFPVLGPSDRTLGSIGVVVFADRRQPKVAVFKRGERILPEVTATQAMSNVGRVLGIVRTGTTCAFDTRIVFDDKEGRRGVRAFADSFDRVRTSDMVVLGTISNIREKAMRVTEGSDSTSSTETWYFDTADIEIERVLDRSDWLGSRIKVCWPHANESIMACSPRPRPGERRIWFLRFEMMAWMHRFLVPDAGSAISADYLEQVEREIAEIQSSKSAEQKQAR